MTKNTDAGTRSSQEGNIKYLKIYRGISLDFCDYISSQFRLACRLEKMEVVVQQYQTFSEAQGPINLTFQATVNDGPFVGCFNRKLINILTNKMLGGDGALQGDLDAPLTFSEEFICEEIFEWLARQYQKRGLPLNIIKTDQKISYFHLSFPEDELEVINLQMDLQGESFVGLSFCHTNQFIEKAINAKTIIQNKPEIVSDGDPPDEVRMMEGMKTPE